MLIKDLQEPYKAMALANQKLQGNEPNEDKWSGAPKSAGGFNFIDTIEGIDFWWAVEEGKLPELTPTIKSHYPDIFPPEIEGLTPTYATIEKTPTTVTEGIEEKGAIEVLSGNKLIAEFMGIRIGVDKYSYRVGCSEPIQESHLNYHESWGWLMPVVEKIRNIGYDFIFCSGEAAWSVYLIRDNGNIHAPYYPTLIEAVYECIIQFIQYYNQQTLNK